MEIDIKPGWKAGTKVRFEREGDQAPNMTPGLYSSGASNFWGEKIVVEVSLDACSLLVLSLPPPKKKTHTHTGDIIFVIREKQHPVFQRDGNDLVYTHNIKLSEALTGTTVEVKTLDKRSLRIPVSDIV